MADTMSLYPDPKFPMPDPHQTIATSGLLGEEVTLEMSRPPVTISFGKYKGQKYEDVETSYLKWMVKELPGTRPRAAAAALCELQRRELGEDLDDSSGAILDLENQEDYTVMISREFIDEATKHPEFLKAFLLREDKELGLISWIHKKACRALMTGSGLERRENEYSFLYLTNLFEGVEYSFEGEKSDRDGRYDNFKLVLWKKQSQ